MPLARKFLFAGTAILIVSGVLFLATFLHGQAYQPVASDGQAVSNLSPEVPQTKQEPCLHCHIQGEHTNLWTPTSRWLVFGTLGLVFLFGFYQSASVWTQRKPFKPLTKRAYEWVDERYRVSGPLSEIANKPVHSFARRWWYCLGGITAFLFIVQGTTGIMLAFYYKPTAADAYASIQFIENEVYFGAAIRAIHHWSANGMIVMCVAHMIRVFVMGTYKAPRELNWVSGVMLLILTLAFGFTGYLLPWDQRAFWASTVGTEIAGSVPAVGNLVLIFLRDGWGVTEATLGRFYGLHILVVPIITVLFMLAHFMMVRRLGVKRPL
jgi:hypothetical protein